MARAKIGREMVREPKARGRERISGGAGHVRSRRSQDLKPNLDDPIDPPIFCDHRFQGRRLAQWPCPSCQLVVCKHCVIGHG
jgi:hypothetical protein